jgi:phage gp29-like protein
VAKRFDIAPIPKGEKAKYTENPYSTSVAGFGGYGSKDLVVNPNDDLLIQKGGAQAFNVYTRLLFDDTVKTALSKLQQEVTAREWKLEVSDDTPGDTAVKEFIERLLRRLQLDEVYNAMLESYIVGYCVAEVMWRRTPQGVVPFDIRFRDPRRFRFVENEDADYGFELRLITKDSPHTGIELPARKFIVFRYWTQANGDPYGAGLGRILYPLVKFKRRALESQLLYSDRFANPTAIAKAPLSATTVEVDTLYEHLSNLSQETALVMPEGFELEFVNPGGTPETFEKLRDSLIRDITLLVAGENEAGSQGAGSLASSEVAQGVLAHRAKDLCELISFTLNDTLVRWVVDLNFGTNVEAPRLWRDFEPQEELSLDIAGVATMVKDIGLRPTTEWIKERFNIELEEDDNSIPTGPEGTSGVDSMTDSGRTLDGQENEFQNDDDDYDDEESGALDDAMNDIAGEEEKEEEPEKKNLTSVIKDIFGFSETDERFELLKQQLKEGKITLGGTTP